jgi:hypothetical protein
MTALSSRVRAVERGHRPQGRPSTTPKKSPAEAGLEGVDSISVDSHLNIETQLKFTLPNRDDGPLAMKSAIDDLSRRLDHDMPDDLTEQQINALFCYASYGHYFGREILLLNSYPTKDMMGRIIAAHVSSNPFLAEDAIAWAKHNWRYKPRNPDPRKMSGFAKVYAWGHDIVWIIENQGCSIKIEAA